MDYEVGDYVLCTFLGEYEVAPIKEVAYAGAEVLSYLIDLERGPRWMSPSNIIHLVKSHKEDSDE